MFHEGFGGEENIIGFGPFLDQFLLFVEFLESFHVDAFDAVLLFQFGKEFLLLGFGEGFFLGFGGKFLMETVFQAFVGFLGIFAVGGGSDDGDLGEG